MNFRKKEIKSDAASGFERFRPLPEQAAASAPPPSFVKFSGKILIVDDEPLIQAVGTRILGKMGNEILLAGTAREALEKIRENPDVALILLDIALPDLKGSELIPAIRELNSGCRIIVCSGYPLSYYGEIPEGADGWLDKPFTLESAYRAIDIAFLGSGL